MEHWTLAHLKPILPELCQKWWNKSYIEIRGFESDPSSFGKKRAVRVGNKMLYSIFSNTVNATNPDSGEENYFRFFHLDDKLLMCCEIEGMEPVEMGTVRNGVFVPVA